MRKAYLALALPMVIGACGGGGDPADGDVVQNKELDQAYNDAFPRGQRSAGIEATESATYSYGSGCNYTEAISIEAMEKDPGTGVAAKTDDQWCAFTGYGESFQCLTRIGGSIVNHISRSKSENETVIAVIAGLADGASSVSYVQWMPFYASLYLSVVWKDDDIHGAQPCEPNPVIHQIGDIDGVWSGRALRYDATQHVGTERPARMTCENRVCTVESAPHGPLTISVFHTQGAWKAATDGYLAVAAMNHQNSALAMTICETPLAPVQVLANCEQFGFSRQ